MTSVTDIHLRALEPEDLELIYQIENDPTFWRFGTTTVPYSRYTLRQYLKSASNDLYADQQVRLVIEGTSTEGQQQSLGLADLVNFSAQHHRAEISLALLPQYQGKHYGETAIKALIEYARRQQLHQIYAIIATSNRPAIQLFERLEFEKSTILKDWLLDEYKYTSACIFTYLL